MATDVVVRSPTLGDVIANAIETGQQAVHVCLPVVVQSYDASNQTVSVHPQTKLPVTDVDGTTTAQSRPVINNVPVQFPGGGGMRITFPIAAGDCGIVIFADQSLDIYLNTGGEVDPVDLRNHDLSDAIYIPGVNPNPNTWKNADPAIITIGSDTGTPDFVATANLTLSRLEAIVNIFNTHIHEVESLGLPTTTPAPVMPTPAPVGSQTVKILG